MLELLAQTGPLNSAEISARTGIAKSTLSNLMETLEGLGWVTRDRASGFSLGSRFVALGLNYLGSRDPVVEFHAACDAVGDQLPYTAQLAVLDRGWSVTYIARRRGRHGVTVASDLGHPLPAHCTGAGKALLGTLTTDQLRARAPRGPLPQLTPMSIADLTILEQDLLDARSRGWTIDDEETLTGVTCRARIVPAEHGSDEALAVSVTFLKANLDEEQERIVLGLVDGLASDLARRLGRRHDVIR